MGMLSRRKGRAFEQETARFYSDLFGDAKRGLQSRDGGDAPDVICPWLVGCWIECKRYARIAVYEWWHQAEKASDERDIVLHIRADREKTLVILSEEHWRTICERLYVNQKGPS